MKQIIIIFFLLSFSSSFAQSSVQSTLKVKGITTDMKSYNSARLSDVTINIYKFNDKIKTYQSTATGRFEFDIEMNTYIVLEFVKDGYCPKRILFDTRNPEIDYTKKYIPFNFEIMMLKQVKGVDYSDVDFPVTIIEYSTEDKQFFYVDEYTQQQIKQQEEVLNKISN